MLDSNPNLKIKMKSKHARMFKTFFMMMIITLKSKNAGVMHKEKNNLSEVKIHSKIDARKFNNAINSTFVGTIAFAQRKVATNKPVTISGKSQLDAKLNHNDSIN